MICPKEILDSFTSGLKKIGFNPLVYENEDFTFVFVKNRLNRYIISYYEGISEYKDSTYGKPIFECGLLYKKNVEKGIEPFWHRKYCRPEYRNLPHFYPFEKYYDGIKGTVPFIDEVNGPISYPFDLERMKLMYIDYIESNEVDDFCYTICELQESIDLGMFEDAEIFYDEKGRIDGKKMRPDYIENYEYEKWFKKFGEILKLKRVI